MIKPLIYTVCDTGYRDKYAAAFVNSARAAGHEVKVFCSEKRAYSLADKVQLCAWRFQMLPQLLREHGAVLMLDIDSVIQRPIEIDGDYSAGVFVRPQMNKDKFKTLCSILYCTAQAMEFAEEIAGGCGASGLTWCDDQAVVWRAYEKYKGQFLIAHFDERTISWRDERAAVLTGKGPVKDGEAFKQALARWHGPPKPLAAPASRRRERMTPDMQAYVEGLVGQVNRYSDPFRRVRSWAMFENAHDEPADMQVAAKVLEKVPAEALHGTIRRLIGLARKAVICMIELDDRGAEFWRAVLGPYMHIARCEEMAKGGTRGLLVMGAPRVAVDGVTVVGAVSAEDQWEQVAANRKRITARMEPAPAHDHMAALACYGPSLNSTMEQLRDLADLGAHVVSVSGAHDAVLKAGIVPLYHVECDPRPHKADNIAAPYPGVTYLLASAIHAKVIDKLQAGGADIRLWHLAAADHSVRLIDDYGEKPGTVIGGGSSVGLRAIPVLYAMGYRRFAIFGMDSSFADDGAQWAGAHAGKKKDEVQVKCGERVFRTSPVLVGYACQFFDLVQTVPDIEWRLYGDGLLQEMARAYAAGALEAA